jgi:hypothetical protein
MGRPPPPHAPLLPIAGVACVSIQATLSISKLQGSRFYNLQPGQVLCRFGPNSDWRWRWRWALALALQLQRTRKSGPRAALPAHRLGTTQ